MRLVIISDTHGLTPELPEGDVLIHAGDATMMGNDEEVDMFDAWLGTLPFNYIIFTPGNHDFRFVTRDRQLKNAITLINEPLKFKGIKVWASPFSPKFGAWAFMTGEKELAKMWEQIPRGTDILITHSPPRGFLDRTIGNVCAGSQSLLDKVREIKPQFHVFGHIHEAYGEKYNRETRFINASVVNECYHLVNKPIVIDY